MGPTTDEKKEAVQLFFMEPGMILIYAAYLKKKSCILLFVD